MSSPRGFTLTYASARRLDQDHAAYLSHGGVVLPVDFEAAPPLDTPVHVELQAPGDRRFVLSGRAARFVPGRGLMVTLDEVDAEGRAALDGYVASGPFRALRNGEPRGDAPAPVAAPQEAQEELDEELPTDPRLAAPATAEQAPQDPVEPPAAAPRSGRVRRPRPAAASEAPAIPPARTSRRPRPAPNPAPQPPAVRTTSDIVRATATPAPPPAAAQAEPEEPTTDEQPAPELTPAAPPPELGTEGPARATTAPVDAKVRPPEPGEEFFVFVVKFVTITSFVELADGFEETARFPVPFDDDGLTPAGAVAQLRLTLPGRNIFEMWGVIEAVDGSTIHVRVDDNDEAFRKALLHPSSVASRKRLEREAEQPPEPATALRIRQEKPKEDLEKMPIRRRLARMGMDDKINLALSGGREARMALAMDGNKAVHHYLLKNAKITLDEIAFMARLPSFNPDVLDKIAENPAYTQNPTIVKALVYNPRTPVKTAIRLLDRLPRSEVMNLAKRTSMNARLVQAAKKKVERRSR